MGAVARPWRVAFLRLGMLWYYGIGELQMSCLVDAYVYMCMDICVYVDIYDNEYGI